MTVIFPGAIRVCILVRKAIDINPRRARANAFRRQQCISERGLSPCTWCTVLYRCRFYTYVGCADVTPRRHVGGIQRKAGSRARASWNSHAKLFAYRVFRPT